MDNKMLSNKKVLILAPKKPKKTQYQLSILVIPKTQIKNNIFKVYIPKYIIEVKNVIIWKKTTGI